MRGFFTFESAIKQLMAKGDVFLAMRLAEAAEAGLPPGEYSVRELCNRAFDTSAEVGRSSYGLSEAVNVASVLECVLGKDAVFRIEEAGE